MTDLVRIPLTASIFDANDPADVTILVDAVTLGTTRQLHTGQTVTWDEDSMERFANTFVGMPINAELDAGGELTNHSRQAIGSIQHSIYDPAKKTISLRGSLWKHYYPETVSQLHSLKKQGKVQPSMEFLADELRDNGNGTVTPAKGRFSGLGLVPQGADLGGTVLLLASALDADSKVSVMPNLTTTTAAPPKGSFEWVSFQAAEHLANMGTVDAPYTANVVGTFANTVVYAHDNDTFRIDYKPSDEGVTFGEPVKVSTTYVPLTASRKDEETLESGVVTNMATEQEFVELKASHDALKTEIDELRQTKTKFDELQAKVADDEKKASQELLASNRLSEVEKIKPYADEKLKEEHKEIFKTADEKTFNTIKQLMASTVELKGGITSETTTPTGGDRDPGELEAETKLPKWREELLARYKTPEAIK